MIKKFKYLLSLVIMFLCGANLVACGDPPPPPDEPPVLPESISVEVVNSDLVAKFDASTNTLSFYSNEYISIFQSDFAVTAHYEDDETNPVYDFEFNVDEELSDGWAPSSDTPYPVTFKYKEKKFTIYVKVNTPTVTKPTYLTNQTFTYDINGNSQQLWPDWMDPNTMDISGNEHTDAGTYDVVISLQDGYMWEDGTTDPVTFQWTIERATIDKPTSVQDSTYWGEPQSAALYMLDSFDWDVMEMTSEEYTDAGTYDVTVSIVNDNYKWSDGTDTPVTLPWTINKRQLSRPEFTNNLVELEYSPNGHSHSILNTDIGYISDELTKSGDIEKTDANLDGEYYTMVISLPNTTNYEWETPGDDVIYYNWRIKPYVLTNNLSPTINSGRVITYNQTAQTTNVQYDEDFTFYTATADSVFSAKNAGTYYCKFELKSSRNFRWRDMTSEQFVLSWTIEKRVFSTPVPTAYNNTFDNTEKFSGWESYYSTYSDYLELTGNSATKSGTYLATLSFKAEDKDSCEWSDGTNTPKTNSWTIDKKEIYELRENDKTYTYDGTEQTFAFQSYSDREQYVVITDNTQTDAVKDKVVTVSLAFPEDTFWSDDTIEPKTYSWTIKPMNVEKPALKTLDGYLYYNKLEQSVEIDGTLPSYMEMVANTNKGINAGNYAVQVELTSTNYKWKDETEDVRIISLGWEILQKRIEKPTDNTTEFRFVSKTENLTYIPTGFDAETMTISGNVQALAGTYTVTVEIIDKVNYVWKNTMSTENQNPVTFEWNILRKQLTKPVGKNWTDGDEYVWTYTGETITMQYKNFDSNLMVVRAGGTGVNAGSYIAQIDLLDKDNYEWSDASQNLVNISWSIGQVFINYSGFDFDNAWVGTFDTYYDGTEKTISLNNLPDSDKVNVVYTHYDGWVDEENIVTELIEVNYYITKVSITPKDDVNYALFFPDFEHTSNAIQKTWHIYDANINLANEYLLVQELNTGNNDSVMNEFTLTSDYDEDSPLLVTATDYTQLRLSVKNPLPNIIYKCLAYVANEQGGWEPLGFDEPSTSFPRLYEAGLYRIIISAEKGEGAPANVTITGSLEIYIEIE